MTAEAALQYIEKIGIIPVIRATNLDQGFRALNAIVEGGVPVVEITMTVPDAPELIARTCQKYGDSVLVGAGTVTSVEEVERCLSAGAKFIVSPGLSAPVLAAAASRDILAIPGAFTPTEVMAAIREGARAIKIFPCSSGGGPKHLKALRGPFPKIALIPTGGVNSANAAEYFAAGAFALGLGGDLIDSAALKRGDLSSTIAATKDLVAIVASASRAAHH